MVAQRGAQRPRTAPRRNDEGAETRRAFALIENPVLHAFDAREHGVQRFKGGALAGDLHHVRLAPVQGEPARLAGLDLVRDALWLQNVTAVNPELRVALAEIHSRAELPGFVGRAAARGDHARLARAINLVDRRAP